MAARAWASRAALVAGVFLVGLTPIADGDIFWHLAAGRHMVATGTLLHADPFSVSALGRPWIDVHWLFQLGAFGVFRAGGFLGLVLVKAALVAIGALVLGRTVEKEGGGRVAFAVALIAALFLARHLLLVRPVVLTLVFLAIFFAVLEGFRRGGRPRVLLALPLLQIVWASCQGLSALGPAVVLCYLAGALGSRWSGRRWYPFLDERGPGGWKPLAAVAAACLLAGFVSPYGARGALLPLELFLRITPGGANVFAREVAENVPPLLLERAAPGQMSHFPVYLAALAVAFILGRRRLVLSRVLLAAALAALALMANRNVLLLYWLATPIALLTVPPFSLRFAPAAGAGALVAVGALAAVAAAREPPLSAPTPFRFPTESARVLAELPGGGAIFAPDHQGGYLIWTLHPRYRPYLDTRLILHTADEFREYLALLDDPPRFDPLASRVGFSYAIVPTGFPDRYLGLAQHLAGSADWHLIYTDGSEALFAHRSTEAFRSNVDLGARATTEAILASLQARYGTTSPVAVAARLHLGKLDLVLGHADEAIHVLTPLDTPVAHALLAHAHLARGDRAAALDWLRRALRADPYNPDARALLEQLERR